MINKIYEIIECWHSEILGYLLAMAIVFIPLIIILNILG